MWPHLLPGWNGHIRGMASCQGNIYTKLWDLVLDFGSLITRGTAWQRGHITGGALQHFALPVGLSAPEVLAALDMSQCWMLFAGRRGSDRGCPGSTEHCVGQHSRGLGHCTRPSGVHRCGDQICDEYLQACGQGKEQKILMTDGRPVTWVKAKALHESTAASVISLYTHPLLSLYIHPLLSTFTLLSWHSLCYLYIHPLLSLHSLLSLHWPCDLSTFTLCDMYLHPLVSLYTHPVICLHFFHPLLSLHSPCYLCIHPLLSLHSVCYLSTFPLLSLHSPSVISLHSPCYLYIHPLLSLHLPCYLYTHPLLSLHSLWSLHSPLSLCIHPQLSLHSPCYLYIHLLSLYSPCVISSFTLCYLNIYPVISTFTLCYLYIHPHYISLHSPSCYLSTFMFYAVFCLTRRFLVWL